MKPSDHIVNRRPIRAIVAAATIVVYLLLPTGAEAAPTLDLHLEHTPTVVSRSDERVDYTVRVKDLATTTPNPTAGDKLFCSGADPYQTWAGTPKPSFTYQWLRNGVPITGATEVTYTLAAEDEGTAIQCLVKGTNVVAAMTVASLPAVVPGPPPSTPPPNYVELPRFAGSRPTVATDGTARRCSPPPNWTISAGATITGGSDTLTAVATAKAKGDLTAGSTTVSGLAVEAGAFRIGQTISGPGIAVGTTIVAVGSSTLELSQAPTAPAAAAAITAGAQPFAVGQTIEGPGIPAGTTITAIGEQTITLSQVASGTGTVTGAQIWMAGAWSFQWLRNGDMIPGATSSEYTPQNPGTDQNTRLQCEVAATGAGGAAVAASEATTIGSLSGPPNLGPVGTPKAIEPLELSFTLPAGIGTFVYGFRTGVAPVGVEPARLWICEAEPAEAGEPARGTCLNGQARLDSSSEWEPLVIATGLAPDTADPAMAGVAVSGAGSPEPATATDSFSFAPPRPFGIEFFETRLSDDFETTREYEGQPDFTQAGGHPVLAVARMGIAKKQGLFYKTETFPESRFVPIERTNRIVINTPRGFLGSARAIPQLCQSMEEVLALSCRPATQVGGVMGIFGGAGAAGLERPVYAIEPEYGLPAQFAFTDAIGSLYSFAPQLRANDGYAVSLVAAGAPAKVNLVSLTATLCSFGLKGVVTTTRITCKSPGEPDANPLPLITGPGRCSGPAPTTTVTADSSENPGTLTPDGLPDYSDPAWKTTSFTGPAVTGCDKVPFEPQASLHPTSQRADSPTGLDVSLTVPTKGIEEPEGIAQANLDNATVTLPQGMTVNPSVASGLAACAPDQIKLGTNEPVACPEASKVGTVEVKTPLLEGTFNGNVYVAQQKENPFKSLLALYLAFESKKDGIVIKVPGKVTPDPTTGQLVATFAENPQQPFSSLVLHFNDGPRAPLVNPPKCGTYAIRSELTPWTAADPAHPTAAETVTRESTFQVSEGPGGGACPAGDLEAKMSAGLRSNQAGSRSPFDLDLTREDGSRRLTGVDVEAPKGLTAYLNGVPYCPDAILAGISEAEGTGRAQLEHPFCPAASQVGTVKAAAGAGPFPFQTSGMVYLAGPYKGAPLSLAVVAPAVAGPFDLGNVVVRSALYVDPETAQVRTVSDPIPTILHGIPLDVRQIKISLDRPGFTLAPTNCEPMSVGATVRGEGGSGAGLSDRFQVSGCEGLGFKPKLKIQLKGATRRIGHPALRAVVTMPQGGANIGRAQVNLPHGEFLDQGNLNKTCTKPVLQAGNCPASSVYGHARAWTPLLEKPLEGNVYLVGGYGYKLPALVAELNGQIRVLLAGKVDSGKNKGIRNTFEVVPDAPVSRFELTMKGGKKYGLLENSENLCRAPKAKRRAIVRFTGQNGKVQQSKPLVTNQCGKKKAKKARRSHGHKRTAAHESSIASRHANHGRGRK